MHVKILMMRDIAVEYDCSKADWEKAKETLHHVKNTARFIFLNDDLLAIDHIITISAKEKKE